MLSVYGQHINQFKQLVLTMDTAIARKDSGVELGRIVFHCSKCDHNISFEKAFGFNGPIARVEREQQSIQEHIRRSLTPSKFDKP